MSAAVSWRPPACDRTVLDMTLRGTLAGVKVPSLALPRAKMLAAAVNFKLLSANL